MDSSTRAGLEATLAGSPYSLPDDERGVVLLEELLPRAAGLERRCQEVSLRVAATLARRMKVVIRTTEIYESNKIEGLGPDLAGTSAILREQRLLDEASLVVAQHALTRTLSAEPKVRDVVGLAAARILVDDYLRDSSRGVAESDLRDMHGLIMQGDPAAGRYKRYVNAIAGSSHHPLAPSDVPAAMSQLTNWIATTDAPLVWKAAVGHAWLTHIHPFEDGNGRVARLLANFTLGHGAYPPLIVRATSDRGRYLDALAASDEGGDITRLVRVFVRVLSRAVRDLEKPDFTLRLFEVDVQSRQLPLFQRWRGALDELLTELDARLLLHNLRLQRLALPGPSDFQRLLAASRAGRRSGGEDVWLAKIKKPGVRQQLLLSLDTMSRPSRDRAEKDQTFPSLTLYVQNQSPRAAVQYLPIATPDGMPTFEYTPIPDERWTLVRRGGRITRCPNTELASVMADHFISCAGLLVV